LAAGEPEKAFISLFACLLLASLLEFHRPRFVRSPRGLSSIVVPVLLCTRHGHSEGQREKRSPDAPHSVFIERSEKLTNLESRISEMTSIPLYRVITEVGVEPGCHALAATYEKTINFRTISTNPAYKREMSPVFESFACEQIGMRRTLPPAVYY